MTTQTAPEIPAELKASLKADRLTQYKARIFNMQMDLTAYQAIGDTQRITIAQQELDKVVTSYYAVEAMV